MHSRYLHGKRDVMPTQLAGRMIYDHVGSRNRNFPRSGYVGIKLIILLSAAPGSDQSLEYRRGFLQR